MQHNNLEVLEPDNSQIQILMTSLRDRTTPNRRFRHNADRLLNLVVETALASLPTEDKVRFFVGKAETWLVACA